MTVYLKEENGKLIPAYNGYNGVTGLADNPELCLANGFFAADESEYSMYLAGQMSYANQIFTDITSTPEYIADQKASQLEILTGQYTNDKCERMVSWVSSFINGISTATSLDDIKSKANTFKTKLAALQSDYTTKCAEVENA